MKLKECIEMFKPSAKVVIYVDYSAVKKYTGTFDDIPYEYDDCELRDIKFEFSNFDDSPFTVLYVSKEK